MKRALAVIGSGYGDEGKGLMTDYLASGRNITTVVRSNGGAQAGHSVQTPDGRRHVFHHIGSGALAGVPTHLSQFFVSQPMFFNRELDEVRAMGGNTMVSIDPRSIVTTPYDIIINQAMEEIRGSAKHGSCGMGFGEAIERSLVEELRLTVGDFEKGEGHIHSALNKTREDWVLSRLAKLGVVNVPNHVRELIGNGGIIERFIDDCLAFWNSISLRDDAKLPDDIVFEGAQGLLLDQDYGAFPYVTRSNTGLKNMVAIAEEAGFEVIEPTYMTRAYATRHGAGPFAYEHAETDWVKMVDPTNQPNPWQGTIRVAPLDLDAIAESIRHDVALAAGSVKIEPKLGISCVDQVDEVFPVGFEGRLCNIPKKGIADFFAKATGIEVARISYGPTRSDVVDVERPAQNMAA